MMSGGFYVPCAPFLYLVPDSAAPPGMELQQRSPGPFHYLISEQAKSLVVLQELQNEVGALLEFRDLVMDTFPHLRTKMAPAVTSTTSPSPPSHIPLPLSSSSLTAGRREWEPGIRVRRKIPPHKDPLDTSLTRRKPLSHQPKSGDTLSAGSSAVQDSGFSTETSSTKETPEAMMTSPPKEIPSTGSGISSGLDEAEDELWNLLDVIHRKGTKLREEVECLQDKLSGEREEKRIAKEFERLCKASLGGGEGLAFLGDDSDVKDDAAPRLQQEFKPGGSMRCVMEGADLTNNLLETNIKDTFRNSKLLLNLGGDGMSSDGSADASAARELKFERDYLLDKLSEMEAETLATRARASQLKTEVSSLVAAKRDLEEQLRTAVSQKSELNTRIHDLHIQFVGKPTATAAAAADNKKLVLVPSSKKPLPSQQSSFVRPPSGTYLRGPSCFAPVQSSRTNIPKLSLKSMPSDVTSPQSSVGRYANVTDAFAIAPSDTDTKSELRISDYADDRSDVRVNASGIDDADDDESEITVSARSRDDASDGSAVVACTRTRAAETAGGEVRLKVRLGTLDGVVSNPSRLARCGRPDRRKVAAILGEFNPLELQRHLLATVAENQNLQQRLDQASSFHASLQLQTEKARDENDELRFQLQKRCIELEGTRAQVRVLERLQPKPAAAAAVDSPNLKPAVPFLAAQDSRTVADQQQQSHPKPSAFLVQGKIGGGKLSYDVNTKPSYDVHHSSTESSHDVVTKSGHSSVNDLSSADPVISPKKRPSKIPLGTKMYAAPKAPPSSGKSAVKGKDGPGTLTSLGKNSVGRNSSLSQKNSLNGRARDAANNGGKMNSFGSNASKNSLGSTGRKSLSRTVSGTQRARSGVTRSNTVVIDSGGGGGGDGGAANGKITAKHAISSTSPNCQKPASQIPVHSHSPHSRPSHTTLHHSALLRSALLHTTPLNTTQHHKSPVTLSPTHSKTLLPGDETPAHVRTSAEVSSSIDRTPTPSISTRYRASLSTGIAPDATRNGGPTKRRDASSRDGSSVPWNHSSSEYYDSINNSSFLNDSSQLHSFADLSPDCADIKSDFAESKPGLDDLKMGFSDLKTGFSDLKARFSDSKSDRVDSKSDRADLTPDTTQLHSCTDLAGECFSSFTQNEAMADYDSLELDVPIRSGRRLVMARNIWVTADSLDEIH